MEASLGDTEPRAATASDRPLDAAPGLTRIAAGAALRTAGWSAGLALRAGRIVRRSIHLTPFGGHFCNYCLPVESAEIETLGTASSSTVDASA